VDTNYSVGQLWSWHIYFCLLDTATVYRNEEAVGRLLKQSIKERNMNRSDIFITSKLGKTS
jgi:diketogulonate reductase-like aldo/keto reductase